MKMVQARPVEISWNPTLPIFARESFLRAAGDEYGWLGGIIDTGELRCILPYVIINKAWIRMVRFRAETIPLGNGLDIEQEKAFLNSAVEYFRKIGIDLIMPASNNSIFRTYPDGANAILYSTYNIDLGQPEEVLWKNIDRKFRQSINTAIKGGVVIKDGRDSILEGYAIIRQTFKRSNLPFMSYGAFKRFIDGLSEYGQILAAQHDGLIQSFVVFGFSDYSAYAIYAGNIVDQQKGSNKFLYWEAMLRFKRMGIKLFDFYGARVNPDKGTKQEALALFKKHFGANMKVGYMWKYRFKRFNYMLYWVASQVRSGGDIVDAESRRIRGKGSP